MRGGIVWGDGGPTNRAKSPHFGKGKTAGGARHPVFVMIGNGHRPLSGMTQWRFHIVPEVSGKVLNKSGSGSEPTEKTAPNPVSTGLRTG